MRASHGKAFQLAAAILAIVAALVTIANADEAAATELFESKVRPIFVERCQKCHGEGEQWAGLRLDSGSRILTGGDSGPAVIPGKPDESLLLQRVTEPDDDLRMPPAETGPRLDSVQIDALRRWIELGAAWPDTTTANEDARESQWQHHWAFQPITHPTPPETGDASWVVNRIDQFVLQKLEAAGLRPSPEADHRTLIRRATYDLLGLPPTLEEVEAFVNDSSPDAYERLIERLLASPRYGEQWGRYWLDVARYSDTKGYVYEREERNFVHSSLYRDWVIQAFNEDLPYNRFVLLQLAADQVAPDDPATLAAMGFLTLGRRFLGVTPDIIDDRIDVVGRGLLGLTIGCARCHDHKYDPIPTADYYSLYGVFQNSIEKYVPIPRQQDVPPPGDEFEKGLRERWDKLQETTALRRAEANARIRARLKDYLLAQRNLDDYPELTFNQLLTKDDLIPGIVRRWQAFLGVAENKGDPIFTPWIAYSKLTDEEFSTKAANVTQQVQADRGKLNSRIADAFVDPPAAAAEVADRYVQILGNVDQQWKSLCDAAKGNNRPPPTALPDASDEVLRQVLYGENSPCVIPDEPIVSTEPYWDLEAVTELWKLQGEFDRWLLKSPDTIPYAVALVDKQSSVEPQVFKRGNPANKGDVVPRQFLAVITGPDRKPFDHGSGRLEMAQAIVDPENPLTARVWVNRVWQHHFGSGLVATPSDFGTRASPPTHPELLDWLASEFVARGWSTKALHRILMLSATYRQCSQVAHNSIAQERDPSNRLLWRMNPQRLSFEQFHDSLVALSGELDLTMGGKGGDLLGNRRQVYSFVDRQFLPTLLGVYDFANPDLHTPQRVETTTPQQALFTLNHPFVARRAKAIASRAQSGAPGDCVTQLYDILFQRDPTPKERQAAEQFLIDANNVPSVIKPPATVRAWSYGYGEVDELSSRLKTFTALSHFDSKAWQGGPHWPDPTVGWAQLTSVGGHAGSDPTHAAVRRWTAELPGTIALKSEVAHQSGDGDGVHGWIISSRHGILKKSAIKNRQERMDIESLTVQPGDTLDFVVDSGGELKNDQFVWVVSIKETVDGAVPTDSPTNWNSERDFRHDTTEALAPLEQLAHLLLMSNELMFVD
jgi:hypothetical protein